jgi:hypothetical protein
MIREELPVQTPVLSMQECRAPGQRKQHQHRPHAVRQLRQTMVILQPAEHGEEIVPVVRIDFLAGEPAEQQEVPSREHR